MKTLDRLSALLADELALDVATIQPDATLESLEIDSLRMLEILFRVEEEFGVSAPSDHNELRAKLKTVRDLAAFIDTLPAQPNAKPS
jgi:acyl carrier protein